jgi:hypothetical protein
MKTSYRILSLFTIFMLNVFISEAQKADCALFRRGTFTIKSPIDESYTIIVRTDSTQTETNTLSNQQMIARITWTSNCSYELLYLSGITNKGDSIPASMQAKPLRTKILKTTKDYCVFESSMDGIEMKYSDTMRILRQ